MNRPRSGRSPATLSSRAFQQLRPLLLAAILATSAPLAAADEVIAVSQSCSGARCISTVGSYEPDGSLVHSSQFDSALQEFTTDVATDASGLTYVLDQTRARVFDRSMLEQGRLGGGRELLNTIVFDAAGNSYLGVFNFTKKRLARYDSRGLLVAQLKTRYAVYSADLDRDQCTLFYISDPRGAQDVHRHNVCANTAMTDFIRISAPNVLQIRLLPDGGLLAAAHTAILRYDSAGHLTRSYDLGGPDYWRSLAIAEDGKSFWAASRRSVVHFDLNDATVSEQFMPADEFTDGIALRHEFRAAASTAGRPASPVDLVATLTPEAKIALSWTDRADNESGFELEYQVREEPFRSLGTVGPDVRLVIVTVPNSVLAYRFRVRAFNARGVSGYSNLATVPDPTAEP